MLKKEFTACKLVMLELESISVWHKSYLSQNPWLDLSQYVPLVWLKGKNPSVTFHKKNTFPNDMTEYRVSNIFKAPYLFLSLSPGVKLFDGLRKFQQQILSLFKRKNKNIRNGNKEPYVEKTCFLV